MTVIHILRTHVHEASFQKTNPTEISWTEEIYGGHLNCFKRKLLDLLIQLLLLELKKKKKRKIFQKRIKFHSTIQN